jgi:Protein of unknown function (DUF4229)
MTQATGDSRDSHSRDSHSRDSHSGDSHSRAAEGSNVDDAARTAAAEVRASHATLRYTTLRLAIFCLALALLWLVRVRGVLLVALALLVSGLASYVLLRTQRDAMSVQLAAATLRRRERAAARVAREDAIADAIAEEDEALHHPGRSTDSAARHESGDEQAGTLQRRGSVR